MKQPDSLSETALKISRLEGTIDGFLTQYESEGNSITEEIIAERLEAFAPLVLMDFVLTPGQMKTIVRRMCEKYYPDIDPGDGDDAGGTIMTPHVAWLSDAIKNEEIPTKRWDAYKLFMRKQGRSWKSIQELDDSTHKILDLAGDPRSIEGKKTQWPRKGLAIGDVQSGKTQMFLGLANKAADAGYRVIVILSGNTEYLRRQTQERVDEGFIGQDSKFLGRAVNDVAGTRNKPIGIRKFDRSNKSYGMTTANYDYLQLISEGQNFPAVTGDSQYPHVFVVKKNSYVLDALDKWAKRQAEGKAVADASLLLIDDESDYASVDTSKDGNDPTKINQAIRRLLTRFTRSSYMAITATPFANIFINHEAEDEINAEIVRKKKNKDADGENVPPNKIVVQDLFPSNYIHALKAPSNYVGLRRYFGTIDEPVDDNLRIIEDCKDVLPIRHKKDHYVEYLPESLKESIRAYFVANTIFDYRGNGNKARSMLINVSKYTDVQNYLAELVHEYVASLQSQIDSFAALDDLSNTEVYALKKTYDAEFIDCGMSWEVLIKHLGESTNKIRTKVYNSKPTSLGTDEEYSAEVPSRQIAIGGDLLSRGLTLDNLIVSYFHRRPMAVDTLMQMARWFGYRDGYFDIVRVWINEDNILDYRNTERAISHLKSQLREMSNNLREPKQFGLVVATRPESLAISAANKLRNAEKRPMRVDLNGEILETAKLPKDIKSLRANQERVEEFIQSVGLAESVNGDRVIHRGIPKDEIAELVENFVISPFNKYMDSAILSAAVRSATRDEYQTWDLIVMSGDKKGDAKPLLIADKQIPRLLQRKVEIRDDFYLVQGRNARLASTHDLRYLLDDETNAEMERKLGRRAKKEDEYYQYLTRPAVLLYLMTPEVEERTMKKSDDQQVPVKIPLDLNFMAGIKIAFPSDKDSLANETEDGVALYWHNTVAQDLLRTNYEID